MKLLIRFVFGLAVVSVGIGVIGVQPAAVVWAGQATEHDHTHKTGAPPTAAKPGTPAAPDEQKTSRMQQGMMARMSAFDEQIEVLRAEMNAAKTTDAKVTSVTKLLNVLIEQRSMMRMQMGKQSMPASPDGSPTQPHGADTNRH